MDFSAIAPLDPKGQYASSTHCRFVEILQYPGQPDLTRRQDSLHDDSLAGWLSGDQMVNEQHLLPSAGLRLLVLYRVRDRGRDDHRASFSCTQEAGGLIRGHFGLSASFFSEKASTKAFTYRYSKPLSDTSILRGLVFKHRPRYKQPCQYAILYDHRSCIAHAMIIVCDKGAFDSSLADILCEAKPCELHPLLLCSIVSAAFIERSHVGIENTLEQISLLTKKTGQHEYRDVPYVDPLDIDFVTTTRSLNSASKTVAAEARMVTSIRTALEVTQKFAQEIALDTSQHEQRIVSAVFQDSIEYYMESCRDLLNTSTYIEKRISTLIQVYQFMTQKDAKTNIALVESSAAIAKAAKADSSAMKTIAILGMFFLPGAFVAAIFAMPVFDWDDNGQPTVKPAFKYYWAITSHSLIIPILGTGDVFTLASMGGQVERKEKQTQKG